MVVLRKMGLVVTEVVTLEGTFGPGPFLLLLLFTAAAVLSSFHGALLLHRVPQWAKPVSMMPCSSAVVCNGLNLLNCESD